MRDTIIQGDTLTILKTLPDNMVDCGVTSPAYWGLRNYGVEGQLGLEPTIEEYISNMTEVFGEVRRVLKDTGTLWLNMGDGYCANVGKGFKPDGGRQRGTLGDSNPFIHPTKPKDLIGQPWRLAFALQADGWYLRSDIIWHKPNPMPESCTDRPTKSHEYLFLLTKKAKYFYDAEAIREPLRESSIERAQYGWNGTMEFIDGKEMRSQPDPTERMGDRWAPASGRNKRTVWTIPHTNDIINIWNGKIDLCQKCGGLRVVGNGLPAVIKKDMDDSSFTIENIEPIESPMNFSSGQSNQGLPLTIYAETKDASIQPILKQSQPEKILCEEIPLQHEMQQKPIAPKGTSTPRRIRISATTENGNAVPVCVCEDGGNTQGSVWKIATQSFSEAHFATFPEALVEPCIRAGTSERGNCAKCGKPWVRVVEKNLVPTKKAAKTFIVDERDAAADDNDQGSNRQKDGHKSGYISANKTLGWGPSCSCGADTVRPIVLDPFMGSGTVGLVAKKLNRDYIGIELNPEYINMAEKRIRGEMGLFVKSKTQNLIYNGRGNG